MAFAAFTSPAAMMTRLEGRQAPDRQGFDAFTLQQLMAQMRIRSVSVVIKDFEIHRAKGLADARPRQLATRFWYGLATSP